MDTVYARCRKIREDDLEMLMNWRMLPEITRYMNTDPKLTMEHQRKWYASLQENERGGGSGRASFHWVLEVDDIPAGYVALNDIDRQAKKLYTNVYIAEKKKRSMRLIVDLQWNLYRFSFETLCMNKVCEEVFAENKAVNRILDLCGSKREGLLRDHICKNGVYYDVVMRGILRSEWEKMRETIQYNYIAMEE